MNKIKATTAISPTIHKTIIDNFYKINKRYETKQ